jgi:large subunit ribosomal protein L13
MREMMSSRPKTYVPPVPTLHSDWHVVDATGQILGRLASEVARRLRGKHKPVFTPHLDTGDHVIVINAAKVVLSGRKETTKTYTWHTHYPGGLRHRTFAQLRATQPERVIERAVRGMLPKNRLGRKLVRKLRVYPGPEHRHEAQKPTVLNIDTRKR